MSSKVKNLLVCMVPLVAGAVLLYVFYNVSPLQFGPAGILLVFVLIYFLSAGSLYLVASLLLDLLLRLRGLPTVALHERRLLRYWVGIIGLAPVFLLALNSIDQLELKDFALVGLLLSVACFYIMRRLQAR